MNIHIVVECWGNGSGDHGYHPFRNRKKAEKRWEELVIEYLADPNRDAKTVIANCKEQGFVFRHSDGFIGLVTETVES